MPTVASARLSLSSLHPLVAEIAFSPESQLTETERVWNLPSSFVGSAIVTDPVRTVTELITPAVPAGPAAPAGPAGPGGAAPPGRARRARGTARGRGATAAG